MDAFPSRFERGSGLLCFHLFHRILVNLDARPNGRCGWDFFVDSTRAAGIEVFLVMSGSMESLPPCQKRRQATEPGGRCGGEETDSWLYFAGKQMLSHVTKCPISSTDYPIPGLEDQRIGPITSKVSGVSRKKGVSKKAVCLDLQSNTLSSKAADSAKRLMTSRSKFTG